VSEASEGYRKVRMGRYTGEDAVATFCIGDVLVHTWDLARATGLYEALDPDEVHRLVEAMEPITTSFVRAVSSGPGSTCRATPTSRRG
jgi:hypothetical protein